jgi:hypothetical protein
MKMFDTNIIIAILAGNTNSIRIFEENQKNDEISISIITLLELLAGISENEEDTLLKAIEDFLIIPFDEPEIAKIAARLRRKYNLKIPDAIIASQCIKMNAKLITFDDDFKRLGESWIQWYPFKNESN